MRTVWKYPLPLAEWTDLQMPTGARIVEVALQGGTPCLWVEADPDAPHEIRRFLLVPTGGQIPSDATYVGTAHIEALGGPIVFHVYEATRTETP